MQRSLVHGLGALALVAVFATPARADTVISGLWSKAGAPSHYKKALETRQAFRDHDADQRSKGRRLADLETYANENGKRRWAGLWEAGTGAQELELQVDEAKLEELIATHEKNGLRLVDIETFKVDGERRFSAVWREGSGKQTHDLEVADGSLQDKLTTKHEKDLRVIDIETYVVDGKRKWLVVWSAGTGRNPVSVGMTLDRFEERAEERNKDGLRLVDIERYVDGDKEKWAGVWRSGSGFEWVTVDRYPELFEETDDFYENDKDLQLVDLEVYDRECGDAFALPFEDKGRWFFTNGNWDDNAGHGGSETGLQAYAWDFENDLDLDGDSDKGGLVLAARGGTVVDLQRNETQNTADEWDAFDETSGDPYPSVGNFVVVDHGDGTYGTYWHLKASTVAVNVGDSVKTGQKLGKVGNTGNSDRPHMHFDVRKDWSVGYPQVLPNVFVEYMSIKVRMHDENHKCWRPKEADILESDNG